MVEYEYRNYFLRLSLVGESSSIRIKGVVTAHPKVIFYDENISRLKKQFEAWIDEIYL